MSKKNKAVERPWNNRNRARRCEHENKKTFIEGEFVAYFPPQPHRGGGEEIPPPETTKNYKKEIRST